MHRLVGQYDSPFLRRVAVTMHCYGIPYERDVLSVFRNADQVAEINPLIKVPVLILPNGEKVFDSQMILEVLPNPTQLMNDFNTVLCDFTNWSNTATKHDLRRVQRTCRQNNLAVDVNSMFFTPLAD